MSGHDTWHSGTSNWLRIATVKNSWKYRQNCSMPSTSCAVSSTWRRCEKSTTWKAFISKSIMFTPLPGLEHSNLIHSKQVGRTEGKRLLHYTVMILSTSSLWQSLRWAHIALSDGKLLCSLPLLVLHLTWKQYQTCPWLSGTPTPWGRCMKYDSLCLLRRCSITSSRLSRSRG